MTGPFPRASRPPALTRRGMLAGLAASVVPLPEAALFVSPSGSDRAAGTRAAPFATIAHAARVATGGQTVNVAPGIYVGNVTVRGIGTRSTPIAFRALGPVTIRGQIQPQGWAGDDSGDPGESSNVYVTFDGFTIETHAPSADVAIRAASGWRLSNCTIRNTGLGLNIRGNDVIVRRCLFEDIEGPNAHAFVGAGSDATPLSNIRIEGCIWRRINLRNLTDPHNSAVHKFLFSRNITITGCTAQDNGGSGIWMDTNNYAFAISHCTVERNRQYGIQIENNPRSGSLIFNVTARGNGGDPAFGTQRGGIALNESQGVEIHHCRCEGNAVASFPIREGSHPVFVADNHCHDNFIDDVIGYDAGAGAPEAGPSVRGNVLDHDVFGPNCTQSYIRWGTCNARSLAECHAVHMETSGSTAASAPAGIGAT